MRLYKVVILTAIALGLGILFGSLAGQWELARLRRELASTKQTTGAPIGGRTWTVKGIVRGVAPEQQLVLITHEDIPGLMIGMTMAFRTDDSKLLKGLTPGDRIEFTLRETTPQVVVVSIRKEGQS